MSISLTKSIIKATRGLTKSNRGPKQSHMLTTMEKNLKVNHLHDCKKKLFVEHSYQGQLFATKEIYFSIIHSLNFLFFFLFSVWGRSEVFVHLSYVWFPKSTNERKKNIKRKIIFSYLILSWIIRKELEYN